MRYFSKDRHAPTDEQRRRLAQIVNPKQRATLLAAIKRGEAIPDYAWTPFAPGLEENREVRQSWKGLVQYAADSGRDMMEVIASLRPESHVQFYADKARETATEDAGYLCATPVDAPDLTTEAGDLTGILCWGIFDPYGPTLSFLTLVSVPGHPESLICRTYMNPFQCQDLVYGIVPDPIGDGRYLVDILDEVVSKYPSGEFGIFSDRLPSFIVPLASQFELRDLLCKAFACIPLEAVEQECALLRRLPHDPWAMATEHLNIERRRLRSGEPSADSVPPVDMEKLDEWLSFVSDPDHVVAYIGQMPHAWAGAIEHRPTQLKVMDWEPAEDLLKKLWCKSFG